MSEAAVVSALTLDYFGPPERQLLGCYHAPRATYRERLVLLLYPAGHEYARSHRAYRRLADQLARAGFAVFRFDYLGTGDSVGESDEIALSDWLEDVRLAVDRVRTLTGTRTVDVVGLRFGATLALMTDSEDVDFSRIVLWQPVLDGSRFVRELRQAHQQFLESQGLGATPQKSDGRVEVLGTGYQDALIREMEAIDLREPPVLPGRKVLVVDNASASQKDDPFALDTIAAHLRDRGVPTTYERRPEPEIWLAEPYKQIMPHESSLAIVTALAEDWT